MSVYIGEVTERDDDVLRASRFAFSRPLPDLVTLDDLASIEDRLGKSQVMTGQVEKHRQFVRDGEPSVISTGGTLTDFHMLPRDHQHRLIAQAIDDLGRSRAEQRALAERRDEAERQRRTCSWCERVVSPGDLGAVRLGDQDFAKVCLDCRDLARQHYLDMLGHDHPSRRAAARMVARVLD